LITIFIKFRELYNAIKNKYFPMVFAKIINYVCNYASVMYLPITRMDHT